MNFDKFEQEIHQDFLELLNRLVEKDYIVSLVGGTVRDFLLDRPSQMDYDCELRTVKGSVARLDTLVDLLQEYGVVKKLEYNIYSIQHKDFSIEISAPRIEKFNGDEGHKNFTAVMVNDPNYETAKRRDFTINAIYFEFTGGWKVIDPLDGTKALNEKKLVPCCPQDFSKDPVRELRLVRFALLFDFEYDQKLITRELCVFGAFHLKNEAAKSQAPYSFIKVFYPFTVLEDTLLKYENDVVADIKTFFKYMPLISLKDKTCILQSLGFSTKNIDSWEHRMDVQKTYEEEGDLQLLYKKLERLPEYIFRFYQENDLININYEQFLKVKKKKGFSSDLDPQEIYKKKFEEIFGNKKT